MTITQNQQQGQQPKTAWALAKEDILRDLTLSDEERKILTTCTVDNVIDDIRALDRQHALKSTSRMVMKFLEPVLTILEKYGPAMDVLAQGDPQGPLVFVWGSIRLLMSVARGFFKYFDELMAFLGDIARPMARLQAYASLVPQSERLQAAVRLVFVDFLKFMHRTRRMFIDKTNKAQGLFTRPGMTVFRKNLWKDFGDEVAREIKHINALWNDAQSEAALAVDEATLTNQARQEEKADGVYVKTDEAHQTIIGHQRQQINDVQVESSLAHRERSRQEKEREDQNRERNKQEEERARAVDGAKQAEEERLHQEEERIAQREERAKAAAEREQAAQKIAEDAKASEATLMKEVVDWLNPIDALDQFRRFREQRMQGTCDWILKNPTCEKWMQENIGGGQPHMLWVNAIPGAGKTFLCTRIVEHLQENNKSVAVFYCDTKDDRKRKAVNLLRTWAWQLLLQAPTKLRNVAELYRSGKQANVSLFADAVTAFLDAGEDRYLVLDALDECESPVRMEILKTLAQFKSAKILITSRNEKDISRAMARAEPNVATIKVEVTDNAEDIRHYLEEKIQEMAIEDKDLNDQIAESLFAASTGMFLYARLMIGELSEKDTTAEIEAALADLPLDLDTIYGRILSRIDTFPREAKRENARLLLKWICAAVEPLTLDQLRDITAFNLDSDEDMLNPKKRLRSTEDFIYECKLTPLHTNMTNIIVYRLRPFS